MTKALTSPRLSVAAVSGPLAPAALPPDEASVYSGVAAKTLANWRSLGVGPTYVRVGGRVVYMVSDLDAWLAAHRISTSSEVA